MFFIGLSFWCAIKLVGKRNSDEDIVEARGLEVVLLSDSSAPSVLAVTGMCCSVDIPS